MAARGMVASRRALSGVHDSVKEYYGKVLKTSGDLKTNACCTGAAPPKHIRAAIARCPDEVVAKYYGCGLVVPTDVQGLRVLDLGSGSGRDCYVLSQLVGPKGSVCGIDMTPEQIDTANKHLDSFAEQVGFRNLAFKHGYIEKLGEAGLEDSSFDLIVSNCVVNLSPDKEAVLREAHRVLCEGGEMYFSDVYATRRVPQHLREDPVLFGECLSGALYWNDFERLAQKVGFADPRLVESAPITVQNADIQHKLGDIEFHSATYRLFKLSGLEPDCEDYGQAVAYKGSEETNPGHFLLDNHHLFARDKVEPVCGNTLQMLVKTRFAKHFDVFGKGEAHYGIFAGCGRNSPFPSAKQAGAPPAKGGCC